MNYEQFQPILVTEADVKSYCRTNNTNFRLIQFVVGVLPRGKVTAARELGRKVLRNPRGITVTASGVKMAIDESNIDFFGELVKRRGTWERHVCDICLELVKPDNVFYDIGANAGYVSLEVAAQYGDRADIHAFEPQPRLAHNIAVSAKLNGFNRLSVYEVMLGADDTDNKLYLAKDSIHASAVGRTAGLPSINCSQTTLDVQVGSGRLPPPNVIKIDVEGAEMNVFNGARETIQKYQPTIVFEADENCERFGYTKNALKALLESLGNYEFYYLDRSAQLIAFESDPQNKNTNMVAIGKNS